MTVISVFVGSTREGRFSEKPAHWILQHLKKRDDVDAHLLDLRDFPMPFFDQFQGRGPPQQIVDHRRLGRRQLGRSREWCCSSPPTKPASRPDRIADGGPLLGPAPDSSLRS
jgi:NADPH-dependent FMN reductase